MITRLIVILLIFFGLLYYFQAPLKRAPAEFQQLHSPYVGTFRNIFNEIINASSSTVIGGYRNYIPGLSGSLNAFPTPSPSTQITQPAANNQNQNQNQSTGTTTVSVNGSAKTNSNALFPVTSDEGEGTLSASGIVFDTNVERAKMGLLNLSRDKKLTTSAEMKLQDMFQNQYFAHISPAGENVSNVVTRAGYDYIVVGENLALGLFPSDASVVAAWMASPGHKRNILDSRYQDMGVAVGQGLYQGRKQWLIVQHFGRPLSACPPPSADLKQIITSESNSLSALEQSIAVAKSEVDQFVGTSNYWAKVDAYNALVTNYNDSRDTLKARLDTYNASVKVFNDCIATES